MKRLFIILSVVLMSTSNELVVDEPYRSYSYHTDTDILVFDYQLSSKQEIEVVEPEPEEKEYQISPEMGELLDHFRKFY